MAVRYLPRKAAGFKRPVKEGSETLPEYLRQLRVSSHYRQNFVAAKLNISRQTYSHYETGRIRPPAGALYGLARLYEVPVESLLSRMTFSQYGIESNQDQDEDSNYINVGDKKPKVHVPAYEDMNQMEKHLIACFRDLGEKDREDILSIMELRRKK